MANAKKLIPFILKWEGDFANHPNDKGGATNKGITIATFRQYYGKDTTIDDLRNMSNEQWEYIFKAGYWDILKANDIANQAIANICVDWAWCSGIRTAIKQVQRLLGVADDGIIGNITMSAINKADSKDLFNKIKSARLAFVESIVRRDTTQKVFLKGWRNRINSIMYE